MATSRREFVVALGSAAALGVLPQRAIARDADMRSDDSLLATIRARRARIRGAHIEVESHVADPKTGWDGDTFAVEGPMEITLADGVWTVVQRRGDVSIVEESRPGRYRNVVNGGAGHPSRIVYDGPPTREHHVRMTIEKFLPAPEDRLVTELTATAIDGMIVRRFAQGDRIYSVAENATILRVERFGERATVVEQIDYSDFRDVAPRIAFPFRVSSTTWTDGIAWSPLIAIVRRCELTAEGQAE